MDLNNQESFDICTSMQAECIRGYLSFTGLPNEEFCPYQPQAVRRFFWQMNLKVILTMIIESSNRITYKYNIYCCNWSPDTEGL